MIIRCVIKKRDGDETMKIRPMSEEINLDGYAIVPIEEYDPSHEFAQPYLKESVDAEFRR